MGNVKKTEFTVVLEGIQLPEGIHKKISQEIQDVVMRNIASTDLSTASEDRIPYFIRPGWRGIVFKSFDVGALHEAAKEGNLNEVREIVSGLE